MACEGIKKQKYRYTVYSMHDPREMRPLLISLRLRIKALALCVCMCGARGDKDHTCVSDGLEMPFTHL